MLALTRRVHEQIVIRQSGKVVARIVVHQIHGDKVRLAFIADADVEINRAELDDLKHDTKEAPYEW